MRRLRKEEGARLREVRLRALGDAPYAFPSSFEREADYAPEVWEERAAQSEAAEASAVFVAVEDGRWLGMAGGYVESDARDRVTLWGMWVDPTARRRGLGRQLVEAVAGWAVERGASCLELSVTDRAQGAAELYGRLGFRPTGERRRRPASHPSLTEVFMTRRL